MSNQPPYGQPPQQPSYPPQPPYGQQPGYPPQQSGFPQYGQQPYGYPPQPQKRGGCLKFGILAIMVVLLACVGGGFLLYKSTIGDANAILDSFMKAGVANDINAAKAFIDTVEISDDQLENLLSQRELFEGYTSIGAIPSSTKTYSGSNEASTIEMTGTINYSSGTGRYSVTMIRLGSEWYIQGIRISRN